MKVKKMEFKQIVVERYATKSFDGKKIPDTKLNELFDIIRYAASSYNIQPYVIKVVADAKLKEQLSAAAWNQPQIKSSSHLLIFCANKDIKENISRIEKTMIKSGAKAEDIKSYIDLMSNFEKKMTDEQKLSWAQRQTYIALGNAINGAKSLGFDSCPMEGFDPVAFSKILKLPTNLVPTALCTIGYANDTPRPKLRSSREELFI